MKGIVEFKSYRTRVAYDAQRGQFTQLAEPHPLTVPEAAPDETQAQAAIEIVTRDEDFRRPPAEPFVALAWTRGPDARASLPTGPRLPGRAKRYVEMRHGHHVRVRCRLPDIDGDDDEQVLIE